MTWEQITAWLDAFSNKPIVIAIVSILTAFAPLFLIFKNTSFGKRAISKLTQLYNLGVERANDTLKKVEEVETLAKEKIEALEREYTQKLEDFENKCEQKVACVVSYFDLYQNKVFDTLEKIPNAKVQACVKEFKANFEEKKKEISDTIGVVYEDYELAIQNVKEEVRAEYDDKIDYLENQIAQLKLFLSEVKGEPNDGEREEEVNSNPTEETLQDSIESL